ncbi:Glycosyltransferase, catalytic subunit of cellulose synthase and poly-beta-1,6-N-acetylglucosamine synthase [Mucilaginibacter lappiensis]|uniref:Cellulose synthase/poly-beta-1,6-N-acetylglucosamine synthase-like glycosyltransferase/peptidoglycan/xylan/chitin deacetylase (PgdA/CDA1 family)/spore germination protein YaaH n=1 Tax=Mucilaginibacter lappiensis TaxID=354630 RepID=A0ABR6PNY9_9SPHI|nr:glycosyltransferase [Mucilaginibacter lappiensis]MBB6111459.1 cellulose synthase/poly-beta-1,6-N-acetylglucosamine synthase-like glycosyltransferase/peptidoglycan/xylan/chitin deacetylase (PgdA/CDA1 family)/spore germination protein YaaH [Mucilaginibacter lappiensis]SIR79631.1 Glycosyltransferase, catalytic subunit of cellulose synthase and poly-beta-1,6-N-acetylglucosamine synthase [Mucilaginibacter lappiensis]
MSSNKQVFQADSPGRWNKFKWLSRILLAVLIIGIIAVIVTIKSTYYPDLPNLNPAPKKMSKEELDQLKRSTKYKAFKIQESEIEKMERTKRLHQLKHPNNKDRINAAFYHPWEPQAYYSLLDNINKLDMIVSEGFSIAPHTDTVITKIDTGLINLNKKYNKPILLTLSNYVNKDNLTGGYDSKDVERIFKSKTLRAGFIKSIVNALYKYKLKGINVDLDEIKDRNSKIYITFQKELYATLSAKKFLVTQNVIPGDDEYDILRLQHVNDFLFVMAIDEHNEYSNAGDISNQHWVEQILDDVCSKIPSEKVILTFAGGAYDWPEKSVGRAIGYQQAISTAQEKQSKIIFDPLSANLHFNYVDQDSLDHTIYFADAATNFNVIRMADDWATGGVALWRMGTEDPRLWSFFQKNLSIDSLHKTGVDLKKLTSVGLNSRKNVEYDGDGEVLDLITTPTIGEINVKLDTNNFTITNQHYIKLPTKYVIRRYGYKPKKVVLTFDDGPDPDFTPRILDILKKENVPAAFFVVGSMAEKNMQLVRREYEEGYEIGNHTFFHPDISTISLDRVVLELNSTRKLIESITGRSTILFRPPFNADAEPQTLAEVIPVAESRRQSYITIGESIDPWDWQPGVTADSIIARTIRQRNAGSMILLHDAGGDTREETVKALPEIIHYFKSHGYQFTTIADVLGKTKADLMPPIPNDPHTGILGPVYDVAVHGYYYINWILIYIFLSAIFLAIGRIVLIGVLAVRQHSENKKMVKARGTDFPLPPVSIIVPAFNEEVNAIATIQSLLKTEYPSFEIIFVDDGSKDKTFEVVSAAYEGNPLVKILTKPNGGKASALNFGITHAKNDYVICIDADTQLKTDAIYHLMTYFTDEEIGAVAGTVKVGNETNIITRWQSIEYITAQNMDRRAFDLINSITVVPGAIGAFRKSAIFKAGGFTYDTLAEDCDLTMRILKQGYIVKNCADAIAYTEAPETINMLLKQRFRWSFGVIQSFWKNRDALFNKKYKFFGMVGMPNILIFQIILPLFSPLADLMMIFALFGAKPEKMLIYYVAFVLIDFIVGIIAFRMEKEDYKKLIYIIPQRFMWRQLMYYVLFKSIRKALKGELSGWGVLKRTGNVNVGKDQNKKTQPVYIIAIVLVLALISFLLYKHFS